MNLKNLISGPYLAYFPNFFGQKKLQVSPCHNLVKANNPIPGKFPHRRKDGQAQLYKILTATAGCPVKYSVFQFTENKVWGNKSSST